MNDAVNLEPVRALRRFKPYPAYKDSDIEWLEEIPAHWAAKRLKHVALLNPEALPEDTGRWRWSTWISVALTIWVAL